MNLRSANRTSKASAVDATPPPRRRPSTPAVVATPNTAKKKLQRWAVPPSGGSAAAHDPSAPSGVRRTHSTPSTPTNAHDSSSDDEFQIDNSSSSSSSSSSASSTSAATSALSPPRPLGAPRGTAASGSSGYPSAVVALAELSQDSSDDDDVVTPHSTPLKVHAKSVQRSITTRSSTKRGRASPPTVQPRTGTQSNRRRLAPRTPQPTKRRVGTKPYRSAAAPGGGRGGSTPPARRPDAAWALEHSPLRTAATSSLHALRLTTELDELPCREEHLGKVLQYLEGVVVSKSGGGCLYVSGMPGTGKTATVFAAIRKVARRVKKPFDVVEVNAIRVPSPNAVFQVIYRSLYNARAPSPENAYRTLDRRFHTNDPLRPFCILVVDEVDALVTKKQHVLYTLFDWPTLPASRLGVIAIANTMDLPERMIPRCASRLGFGRLDFYPYTRDQLVTIVTHRLNEANKAIARGCKDAKRLDVDSSAVEMCARKVASLSGDIRRALQICRIALQAASQHVDGKVKLQDIVLAAKQLHQSTSEEVIATLPLIQKLFLLAVISELRTAASMGVHLGAVPLFKIVERLRNEVNNIGFYGANASLMPSHAAAVLTSLVEYNLVNAFTDVQNKENAFKGTAAYCDEEAGAWIVTLVPLVEEVQTGLSTDDHCRRSLQKLGAI